ncbi:MAG: hypothetical protein R2843_05055 [Thermomicrobiales bacterium]
MANVKATAATSSRVMASVKATAASSSRVMASARATAATSSRVMASAKATAATSSRAMASARATAATSSPAMARLRRSDADRAVSIRRRTHGKPVNQPSARHAMRINVLNADLSVRTGISIRETAMSGLRKNRSTTRVGPFAIGIRTAKRRRVRRAEAENKIELAIPGTAGAIVGKTARTNGTRLRVTTNHEE